MRLKSSSEISEIKTFGDSMYPLLADGDVVYYKKTQFSKIKVEDLVGFIKKGKIINHRVVYKSKKYILTKGDYNLSVDSKVFPRDLVGKIQYIKRRNQIINPETIYVLQSTHYFLEIVSIKKAFEHYDIKFVILKGLPLHLYYQKTYPRRIYADCDILINPADFKKVNKILESKGYSMPNYSLSSVHHKLNKERTEVVFTKLINGFTVSFDVHLEAAFLMTQLGTLNALYPSKLISEFSNRLLQNQRQVKIENETFPILEPSYLIIYLALHLFHHNFRGYNRFEILNLIFRKEKVNTQKLVDTAQYFKLSGYISLVFLLLKKYYKTPIEAHFINCIIKDFANKKSFRKLLNVDIFSDELRIKSGVTRFRFLLLLSPNPLYKKMFVFFNIEVIYSIAFVLYKRYLSSFPLLKFFYPKASV